MGPDVQGRRQRPSIRAGFGSSSSARAAAFFTGTRTPDPNSQVRNNTTYGILKLTLRSTSYDWQFVPVPDRRNRTPAPPPVT